MYREKIILSCLNHIAVETNSDFWSENFVAKNGVQLFVFKASFPIYIFLNLVLSYRILTT